MGKEERNLSVSPADTGAQQGKGETVAVPKTVFGRDAQALQGLSTAEEQESRDPLGAGSDVDSNAQVPGAVAKHMAELQRERDMAQAELERRRTGDRDRKRRSRERKPEEERLQERKQARERMRALRARRRAGGS